MKRKDLADVLIKILGLYVCLNAIPALITQPVTFLEPFWYSSPPSVAYDTAFHMAIASAVSFGLSDVVTIGIGILLLVKSKRISEFLFKNEDE
jgi:hypothetical protein